MAHTIHNLGFPRIGAQRELKTALESYWRGSSDAAALYETGKSLRERHWQQQQTAGLQFVPTGDFAWYDHIATWAATLGVVSNRYRQNEKITLNSLFLLGRGRAPSGQDTAAGEMTKWFDTNYHYIVPELKADCVFNIEWTQCLDETAAAIAQGLNVKPVIPGPLTFLWLSKGEFNGGCDDEKLLLLDKLLLAYEKILQQFALFGVSWVQIDEPILVLELPLSWQTAFERAYHRLQNSAVKLLLTTYFGGLNNNLMLATRLPVAGLHIDCVRAPEQLKPVVDNLGPYKILSVGIIDGRNIWRTNLAQAFNLLQPLSEKLGDRLWLAPSCSLLHVPVDLAQETELDTQLHSWLSFAIQKLDELNLLSRALSDANVLNSEEWQSHNAAMVDRQLSSRTYNHELRARLENLPSLQHGRSLPYSQRIKQQQQKWALPLFPTTTIGSFPQTADIRKWRKAYRDGDLDAVSYERNIKAIIAETIALQEALGLDVLVHGESERNDMSEYFGEHLTGIAVSEFGWVQSYGSRCVKPPIIYGDILRPAAITVEWSHYAQTQTQLPVKGMLTGPVTLLCWSFVRDDQSRKNTCQQLALALRDEVADLQAAGIGIIQIDEPAFREGQPLNSRDKDAYYQWAVNCFHITTGVADDTTQIHTHMCYSDFNDIMKPIAQLDADVITLETARSRLELLDAQVLANYPSDIGPGVWDIHSPIVPSVAEIQTLLERAAQLIPVERLWVNPDCGLKTRGWPETLESLRNMVTAAQLLRKQYAA
ncbi:MAG: 5-methyltetrahydropteroyltriglutamate--homocysteine S-methyltransferase [Gammaproteobacteria bacterium]|nr:5-methyltetrahydropteroyltriglutamate--homocysteine S-methyltransferase [Gammaproteobacteria bacterium]